MRALLLVVLLLTACTTQPNAGASPTPSPTASATTTPTTTPAGSPTPSPLPIPLPTTAELSAPSGTVVWALIGRTRLFLSTDRGDTWVERSMPPGLADTQSAFADPMRGLLLNTGTPAADCQTQTVELGSTLDGAASWQRVQATGIAPAMCKSGLSAAADSPHAWFTAYRPNNPLVMYHTADRGQTWTASAPLPVPPALAAQAATAELRPGRPRAFGSIVLLSVNAVVAGQGTRYVLRSTDAGATFTYASTVPTTEGSVAFLTAARWLVIAPSNASQQTVDGGASWQAFPSEYSQAAPIAPEIVFGDAMVGYATVRGAIQRTTDSGIHWTTIKTPGT